MSRLTRYGFAGLVFVATISAAIYFKFASLHTSVNQDIKIYDIDHTMVSVTREQPYFILKLASNPSTGYVWNTIPACFTSKAIVMVKKEFIPNNKNMMGSPGYEFWTFRVDPEGFNYKSAGVLRMFLARPWDPSSVMANIDFKILTGAEIPKGAALPRAMPASLTQPNTTAGHEPSGIVPNNQSPVTAPEASKGITHENQSQGQEAVAPR